MLTLAAVVLVVALVAGVVLLLPAGGERATLAAARERWDTRPFASYRILVNDICEKLVTVDGARVVDSSATNVRCEMRGRSIDELFALISRDNTVTAECVSRHCLCDDVMSVSATYDPQLGYPRSIEVRVGTRPNAARFVYWQELWKTWQWPQCGRLMDGSKVITVRNLVPLF
jgi:hypothetical protein